MGGLFLVIGVRLITIYYYELLDRRGANLWKNQRKRVQFGARAKLLLNLALSKENSPRGLLSA